MSQCAATQKVVESPTVLFNPTISLVYFVGFFCTGANLLLLLCWCGRGVGVFLDESGLLRDHVGDAVNDGVGDAELLIDQLVGLRLVSVRNVRSK